MRRKVNKELWFPRGNWLRWGPWNRKDKIYWENVFFPGRESKCGLKPRSHSLTPIKTGCGLPQMATEFLVNIKEPQTSGLKKRHQSCAQCLGLRSFHNLLLHLTAVPPHPRPQTSNSNLCNRSLKHHTLWPSSYFPDRSFWRLTQ